MLRLLLLCSLFLPRNVSADLEHKAGQGSSPSPERLKFTRACFSAIHSLGCPHPAENPAIFKTCLEQKNEYLTPECSSFFSRLYKARTMKDRERHNPDCGTVTKNCFPNFSLE